MTLPTSVDRAVSRAGYTLIEMLTTIAVLVVVLGLMVSLSRHVRAESSQTLTKLLLRQLQTAMAQYDAAHRGAVANVWPLIGTSGGPQAMPDEAVVYSSARRNNQEFLDLLRSAGMDQRILSDLPVSVYDPKDGVLRDAWGNPIVFMARTHSAVGMAPHGTFFFFSAGPDGHYLTRADNLYSYEGYEGDDEP